MKTLIVTMEYPPQVGGIAQYIEQFARYQKPEDLVILAPAMKGGKEYDVRWPWKVIRRDFFFPLIWPHWLRLFLQVRALIKSEGILNVHVHQVLPVGYIAYWLKRHKKIASYSVFLHGTDLALAETNKRKYAWVQKICGLADQVVVNSQYLAARAQKLGPAIRPMVVHPCPADYFFEPVAADRLTALRSQLALTGKKVLVSVGRMVPGKGFLQSLELLPELLKRVPNLVWLMIGNGPERQQVLNLVQKNGLQNAVRLLGDIPSDYLPGYYQVADAFALLTHPVKGVEESWGTVLLEAAASGLAVVAGRSGGVTEAVIDGITGRVVDVFGDTNGTIDALVDVLNNPEVAHTLGQAGRGRALAEFTLDRQLRALQ